MGARHRFHTPERIQQLRGPQHTGKPRLPGPTALRVWMAKNPEASPKEIADLLDVHSTSFLYWTKGRRNCSPLHALQIEQLTKGEVPRHLWPSSQRARKQAREIHERQLAMFPTPSPYGEITAHAEEDVPADVAPVDVVEDRQMSLIGEGE